MSHILHSNFEPIQLKSNLFTILDECVDYSKMYRKKVCGKKKYPETANIDYSK
jgi:hypothetical protein